MTDEEENWWFDLGYKDYYEDVSFDCSPGYPEWRDPWETGWRMARREYLASLLVFIIGSAALGLFLWYTDGFLWRTHWL